jgi:hypothetical protein
MTSKSRRTTQVDSDDEFIALATIGSEGDPYRNQGSESDDVEMIGGGQSEASKINTITDLGVQSEIGRLDYRIDTLHNRVHRLGCCGPKRLAFVVFFLFVLIIVNFVLDFWHMIMDLVQRLED